MTLDMSKPAQLRRCASNIADEFPHWSQWLSECANDVAALTAEVERLREALEDIAQEYDAGRHDGLPEPYPALDAETMWAIAFAALNPTGDA